MFKYKCIKETLNYFLMQVVFEYMDKNMLQNDIRNVDIVGSL